MYEEVVIDSAGQKLAYVYFEDEPGPALGRQAADEGRGAAGKANGERADETLVETV